MKPMRIGIVRVVVVVLGTYVASSGFSIASVQVHDQPASTVRLPGEIDLAHLLDLAAAQNGVSLQYAEDLSRRKIRIRDEDALSPDQLWNLVSTALFAQGFVTVEIDGGHGLYVVASNHAMGLARIQSWDRDSMASYRRVLVPTANVPPESVATAIEPLLSPQLGTATVVPGGVVVSDMSARLDTVLPFARELDRPGRALASKVIKLSNTTAADATARLASVWAARDGANGTEQPAPKVVPLSDGGQVMLVAEAELLESAVEILRAVDTSSESITELYPIEGFELGEVAALVQDAVAPTGGVENGGWRLVEDSLTRALIITTSAENQRRVQEVMDRLSSIPDEERRPARTFVIQNRSVTEVADILADLINTGLVGGTRTAAPDETAADTASDLLLTVDEGSNTIFASATSPVLDQIERLLPALDVRLPQVQVEVMLVSLSESQSRDLGVELQKLLDDAGTLVGLSSLFGLGSPAITATDPLIGGAGSSVVVLDPGDFSVVVRALESVNDGRTLSMPKVLVNNNEDATIDSVLQQPFISTNAGDTISTTSFGGFEDAGTQVTVTPQIAAGDHLVLRYSINLSSFVGDSASPEAPPPRQQNSISSVATIPDGFTVVVGGIELQTEGYGEDRLPVLGRIPLVGNLFKSTSKSSSRQRFFAFIRATTLRDSGFEELKYLSEAAVEETGIDDGWPKVQPRVIR